MPADTKPKHAELVRDRGGPEDPTIREARRAAHRPDNGDAFLPDPMADGRRGPLPADDAEWFAEEFIATATTGEPIAEDARDEVSDDEDGGPYLELSTDEEVPDTIPEPTSIDEEVTPSRNLRSRHLRRPAI